MRVHVKILGWFYIAIGAVMAIAAAAGQFTLGELETWEKSAQSLGVSGMSSFMTSLLGFWLRVWVVFLVLNIMTGIGLLTRQVWALPLAILLSVVSLFNFPIGMLIGAYGLWVLLSRGAWRVFARLDEN